MVQIVLQNHIYPQSLQEKEILLLINLFPKSMPLNAANVTLLFAIRYLPIYLAKLNTFL